MADERGYHYETREKVCADGVTRSVPVRVANAPEAAAEPPKKKATAPSTPESAVPADPSPGTEGKAGGGALVLNIFLGFLAVGAVGGGLYLLTRS